MGRPPSPLSFWYPEGVCCCAPYMYPAKFAGVRRRPRPNLAGIPDAPLQTVGFSFPPSLTAEETADVTQTEDEAADRNRRAAKQ